MRSPVRRRCPPRPLASVPAAASPPRRHRRSRWWTRATDPCPGTWLYRSPSTPSLGSSVTSNRSIGQARSALTSREAVPTGPTQLVVARRARWRPAARSISGWPATRGSRSAPIRHAGTTRRATSGCRPHQPSRPRTDSMRAPRALLLRRGTSSPTASVGVCSALVLTSVPCVACVAPVIRPNRCVIVLGVLREDTVAQLAPQAAWPSRRNPGPSARRTPDRQRGSTHRNVPDCPKWPNVAASSWRPSSAASCRRGSRIPAPSRWAAVSRIRAAFRPVRETARLSPPRSVCGEISAGRNSSAANTRQIAALDAALRARPVRRARTRHPQRREDAPRAGSRRTRSTSRAVTNSASTSKPALE